MCACVCIDMLKKIFGRRRLKKKIKEQDRVIEMLSNQEVVKGLNSALEDVKNGEYIVLTN